MDQTPSSYLNTADAPANNWPHLHIFPDFEPFLVVLCLVQSIATVPYLKSPSRGGGEILEYTYRCQNYKA